MKRAVLLIFALFCCHFVKAQEVIPVNDTAYVQFGDSISIDVVANDIDTAGHALFVSGNPNFVMSGGPTIYNLGILSRVGNTVKYKPSLFADGWIKISYYVWDTIANDAVGYLSVKVSNPSHEFLNINNVSARINSYGNHFWNEIGNSQYFIPKNSLTSTLFAFDFWAGGLDINGSLHLAGETYSSSLADYYSGPVSTVYDANYDKKWNRVWKITKAQIDYYRTHWWQPGYIPVPEILTWPGNGDVAAGQASKLAPFFDLNNDGIYDPLAGDYPLIKGDETVFFIFNDDRGLHQSSKGSKLGIEIQGMAYAFDCPQDSALWYSTFLHYDVINRSTTTFTDTYFGVFVDGDIGYPADDYVGSDVQRGSFYFYNGRVVDGSGQTNAYGYYPPAQSVTILGGPYLDPDGIDNPKYDTAGHLVCGLPVNGANFEDGIIDNERFGMSRFCYFTNPGSAGSIWATSDPANAPQYYKYLKGLWLDSTRMQYGQHGYHSGGPDCNFMYPWDSDPCNWGTAGIQPAGYSTGAGGTGPYWNEADAGNPPNDRRGLASMGTFTFEPGAIQPLDIAFVFGRNFTDTMPTAALTVMKQRIDSIRTYFNRDSTPCGTSFSAIRHIFSASISARLYPNPANNRINLEYSTSTENATYSIFNMMGEEVAREKLSKNILHPLNIATYKPGLYLVRISDGKTIIHRKFIKR